MWLKSSSITQDLGRDTGVTLSLDWLQLTNKFGIEYWESIDLTTQRHGLGHSLMARSIDFSALKTFVRAMPSGEEHCNLLKPSIFDCHLWRDKMCSLHKNWLSSKNTVSTIGKESIKDAEMLLIADCWIFSLRTDTNIPKWSLKLWSPVLFRSLMWFRVNSSTTIPESLQISATEFILSHVHAFFERHWQAGGQIEASVEHTSAHTSNDTICKWQQSKLSKQSLTVLVCMVSTQSRRFFKKNNICGQMIMIFHGRKLKFEWPHVAICTLLIPVFRVKKRSINVADGGATISYVLTGVVVNKYFTTKNQSSL